MAGIKHHVDAAVDTVVDAADTTPRRESPKGKRIKAIPFATATTVVVREEDFKTAGNIDHKEVAWDFRVDDFTVAVGNGISAEAADFLVNNYPDSFHYVGE